MKRFIIGLLLVGLLFAGEAFPQAIPGTELVVTETIGDMTEGGARYSTDDAVIVAQAVTEPYTAAQWQGIEQDYIADDLDKTIDGGITYYHVCTEGDYPAEIICYMDTHKDGTYYQIDVSVIDESETVALETGIKIGREIIGTSGGAIIDPTGDVVGPIVGPGGGTAGGTGGTVGDFSSLCCPSTFILLALAGFAISRR